MEYDVFVTDFFEMHNSEMDEQIEIWDEVIGKLKNGYNKRRYKIVSNKDVTPGILMENELIIGHTIFTVIWVFVSCHIAWKTGIEFH